MGDIHEETHMNRSSGMSFALRWGHEHRKSIFITTVMLAVAILVFWLLMYGTAIKKVTVAAEGEEHVYYTRAANVQSLLEETGFKIRPYDRLSKPMAADLSNGDTIEIEYAKPIRLTVGGQNRTAYTTAETVEEVLAEFSVDVGELDKVTPALQSTVAEQMQIRVVKVEKEMARLEEKIPFTTVTKQDPTLLKGKQKVVQEGKEGVLVKNIENIFEDGELKAQNVVAETVESESVDKVVAVGTRNPVTVLSANSEDVATVTKDDITFKAKQVLKNVTLTAYHAGVESTGKDESHPAFGVTASGTKVTEGRTIAVDPNVIPMGWWVYIDGIGFRRAEDTGGAVKGKKIDIYFEDEAHVSKFGLKRGYTVYVIGPVKPSAN